MALGLALGEKHIPELLKTQRSQNREWSGYGRSAPTPAGLSLGSPSFSISVLTTKELEKYLVVARDVRKCGPHA